MPISSPPQTLPTLPTRDDLNTMVNTVDCWGTNATDGVFYFTGGGSEIFTGDVVRPVSIGFPTSGTVPAINYSTTPLVLSWFDYFALEYSFFVPDFGQAGTAVFGIGLTTGAGTPCSTTSSLATLRFARFGTTCTGTVNAGVWNVFNGPVSNQVVFNTTTNFSVNTWYRGKIEYTKSPRAMMYYVDDVPIIAEGAIGLTNIPDTQSLSVRISGSLTVDPSPVNMLVNWIRLTGELSSYSREPV